MKEDKRNPNKKQDKDRRNKFTDLKKERKGSYTRTPIFKGCKIQSTTVIQSRENHTVEIHNIEKVNLKEKLVFNKCSLIKTGQNQNKVYIFIKPRKNDKSRLNE